MFSSSAPKPVPSLSEFPLHPRKGPSSDDLELRCKKGELYVHSGKPALIGIADSREREQVAGMVALLKGLEKSLRASVATRETGEAIITLLRQRTVTLLPLETIQSAEIDSKTIQARMKDNGEKATVGHLKALRTYCTELAQILGSMRQPNALAAQAALNHLRYGGLATDYTAEFIGAVADRMADRPGLPAELALTTEEEALQASGAGLTARTTWLVARPAQEAALAQAATATTEARADAKFARPVKKPPPVQQSAAHSSSAAVWPAPSGPAAEADDKAARWQYASEQLDKIFELEEPPKKLLDALSGLKRTQIDDLLEAIRYNMPLLGFRLEKDKTDTGVRMAKALASGKYSTAADAIAAVIPKREWDQYRPVCR